MKKICGIIVVFLGFVIGPMSYAGPPTQVDLCGYLLARIDYPGPFSVFEMNLNADGTFTYQSAGNSSKSPIYAGSYTFKNGVLNANFTASTTGNPEDSQDPTSVRITVDFNTATTKNVTVEDDNGKPVTMVVVSIGEVTGDKWGKGVEVSFRKTKAGNQVDEYSLPYLFFKRSESYFSEPSN